MFPGTDNLGQGVAVQEIAVAANIKHTHPSHIGEAATVYTLQDWKFCDLITTCTLHFCKLSFKQTGQLVAWLPEAYHSSIHIAMILFGAYKMCDIYVSGEIPSGVATRGEGDVASLSHAC